MTRPKNDAARTVCGGAWNLADSTRQVRPSKHSEDEPDFRYYALGFRTHLPSRLPR